MRNLIFVFSLFAMLMFGCYRTTAGPSAGVAAMKVPPIRPGTTPQKWEYFCFMSEEIVTVARRANKLGKVGFELAAATGDIRNRMFWCFKRRLP